MLILLIVATVSSQSPYFYPGKREEGKKENA
jgi:hypothetical protein